MKQRLQFLFFFIIALISCLPNANAQFVNFEDTWKEFLDNNKISNISEMPKPSKSQKIDYVRYCLMYANSYFCSGEIKSAENMMAEIKKIGGTTYNTITGFSTKYEDLDTKIKAYYQVDRLWKRFQKSKDVSLAELEQAAVGKTVCEKGTLAKYSYMQTHALYCKGDVGEAKNIFEKRVLQLAERTSLKVGDIEGLEAEVKMMKTLFGGLPKLGKAWKEFTTTDESPGFDMELPLVECYSIPSMKEYVLRAATDVCNNGPTMLGKVQKLQASNSHPIDAALSGKIKWLEEEVGKNNGDVAVLDKAWKEFLPSNTLKNGINFGYTYCQKEAEVRAYVMTGILNACDQGELMLSNIDSLKKEFSPKLDKTISDKVAFLQKTIQGFDDDFANLEKVWGTFIEKKDTLTEPFQLAEFYCDKIAQVKSWTIKGHMNECKEGQQYLDKIAALKKSDNLEFDEELACRVRRLQIEVWDCRYWELVMQARKETHEERERFGPPSAAKMQAALNSDKLPCDTGVKYSPLGNIGMKYIISTYLCQEIDLAKMGDPEYYKKIATWVDTEVLQKYCEADLRCKEEFVIYIEGHTDGNPFRGARYKRSLDIPQGTSFTHFLDNNIEQKQTEKEITNSLKSNMELGIARAWTVKQQLDFMNVPIAIGAFEHPKSEKGGEYRKVEVMLNIKNLLLDFYEKRLKELLEASGIGERPETC